VVLQGDAGFSRKSEQGQASYYYSQPYLGVSGTITLDGRATAVK
jgi:predicted secreted hydrolase